MFCPYCGKEIEAGFVYCFNCGRKIPHRKSEKESPCNECVKLHANEREKSVGKASDSNRLEMEFRALVKRLPSEALAHFKNVDKGVWRVVKAGLPEEDVYRRHGLIGPYAVKICGVLYHAYARDDLLAASQVKFLRVWSGGAKKGIRRIRQQFALSNGASPHRFVTHMTFFIVLFGILLAVFLLATRWGGTF